MSKFRKKPRAKKRINPNRLPSGKYKSYIISQAWYEKKTEYRNSKLPQNCLVCQEPKVDLHHRTYKRLGGEWLNDLVPLCRQHHDGVHSFHKKSKMNLWGATKYYVKKNKA